jgi:short-subunit dehydrogenase
LGIYSATKFGLRGFNDALRRELWQDNIDVVLIAPGFIQTPMTSGLKIPMPGPEAVVNAILSAIRRPRRKIVVPWVYRLLMYFGKLTPWLVDRIIGSNQGRKAYTERD